MDRETWEAQIAAWAVQPLPVYEVDGWAGERVIGASSGLPHAAGEPSKGFSSVAVEHLMGDEVLIEVWAHRPDTEHFDDLKAWTPVNTFFRACGAPGVSAQQQADFGQAAEDCLRDRSNVLVQWERVMVSVEGQLVPFDLCRVVGEYWCAVGTRPDVHLTLHSSGLPATGLSLVKTELQLPDP
jgi:hypothetical protein